jgi:hypothetical protein
MSSSSSRLAGSFWPRVVVWMGCGAALLAIAVLWHALAKNGLSAKKDTQIEVHFGALPGHASYKKSVYIRNTSDRAWTLATPISSCMCVKATLKYSTVPSGQSAPMDIEFRIPAEGSCKHTIIVPVNDMADPILVSVDAVALGPPHAEPQMINVESPLSMAEAVIFSAPAPEDSSTHLVKLMSSIPEITSGETSYALGGDMPKIRIEAEPPFIRNGRITWRVRAVADSCGNNFRGLTSLFCGVPEFGMNFPPIMIRWDGPSNGDPENIIAIRKSSKIALRQWHSCLSIKGVVGVPLVTTVDDDGKLKIETSDQWGVSVITVDTGLSLVDIMVVVCQ